MTYNIITVECFCDKMHDIAEIGNIHERQRELNDLLDEAYRMGLLLQQIIVDLESDYMITVKDKRIHPFAALGTFINHGAIHTRTRYHQYNVEA